MHNHGNVPDDLIDRYLRDQLSGEALANFEVRMLEEPEFFAAVQRAEMMREQLRGQLPLPAQSDNVSVLPFRFWIRQPMSLAASVLLAVGVLLGGGNYLQQDASLRIEDGYAVSSVVTLGATRSTQNAITLPRGVHLLQVDVGVSLGESRYILKLAGEREYEFSVVSDANGVVRVLTPESLSGVYLLTVREAGNDETLQTYQLAFEGADGT